MKMGQADIYEFLEKHKGKKYTNAELAGILDVGTSNATMCTKKLRSCKLIEMEIEEGQHGHPVFYYFMR